VAEPTESTDITDSKADSAPAMGQLHAPTPQNSFLFCSVNGRLPLPGAISAFQSVKSVDEVF
jgi:hypothetical protein